MEAADVIGVLDGCDACVSTLGGLQCRAHEHELCRLACCLPARMHACMHAAGYRVVPGVSVAIDGLSARRWGGQANPTACA